MQTAIPAVLMRGGTSRGLYFHGSDLPSDTATRDAVLLAAMGSPDPRQIDGVGGAHPLTSKVAVIAPAGDESADVDYLFLQVKVEDAEVSDAQNCGNLLAGVGPFALENGLMEIGGATTDVRIRMCNTGGLAVARVCTPGGQVSYTGDARIDGVPGTAAPVMLDFRDVAGASCGALLPTGEVVNEIDGIDCTLIDNGMPVVVMNAADLGKTGDEAPAALEDDTRLAERIEAIRLKAGSMMNLGDVGPKTVPKMCLVSPPRQGGAISTRTFIPHRVHEAIGVLGAVGVATACVLPGSVAAGIARGAGRAKQQTLDIEHPTGRFTVELEVEESTGSFAVRRAALLRTARKLMDGCVYVPANVWGGA